VSKSFEGVHAVSELSLRVPEGLIFGFLGPNGAGKTTTMRVILDILRPDTGAVRWRGRPVDDQTRRRFGYLPEERGLYPKMKVLDQLVFFARLYGMPRAEAAAAAERWLERFGIADRRGSRLEELSRGNQQKVQVLVALVHDPDLALLDEPFSGLDPLNSELLEAALRDLRDRGKTVLYSSHRLEQVEDLCEEVAIIARGQLRLSGNLEAIRDSAARRILHVRTASRIPPDITGLPLDPEEPGRDYARFSLREGADPQLVLQVLAARETVEYFAVERPSLQEIFIEATADGAGSSNGDGVEVADGVEAV